MITIVYPSILYLINNVIQKTIFEPREIWKRNLNLLHHATSKFYHFLALYNNYGGLPYIFLKEETAKYLESHQFAKRINLLDWLRNIPFYITRSYIANFYDPII